MRHDGVVLSASFSPDGRRVVTASNDNTARIWDANTGKPIGPVLEHDSNVNQGVFSPDGSRVATVSDDGTARVWNMATNTLIGVPLQTAGNAIDVDWSPDGQRLTIATRVRDLRSASTSDNVKQRRGTITKNATAVSQSTTNTAPPEQRLRPNAAYVVRAPQTRVPSYAGQGGAARLRERIGLDSQANIRASMALIMLATVLAWSTAWRQRRKLGALRLHSAS
jgi:dipeptidyl aminopeptidase/acylaminoacyl peptidase